MQSGQAVKGATEEAKEMMGLTRSYAKRETGSDQDGYNWPEARTPSKVMHGARRLDSFRGFSSRYHRG